MKELKRTVVDKFDITDSVDLEKIKENSKIVGEKIISIEKVFQDNKEIRLDKRKLELFLNGVMLSEEEKDGVYRIYCEDSFIGLGTINKNLLKRDVVL